MIYFAIIGGAILFVVALLITFEWVDNKFDPGRKEKNNDSLD